MSKEQELKLLSKEEIEKNRIKAYKCIDMSKEQTIEEGLKEVLEVIDGNGVPNMNWVRNKLHELLTIEKEQREELIKNAVIYGIEYGEDYLRYNPNQVKKIADSYYNNHIKK